MQIFNSEWQSIDIEYNRWSSEKHLPFHQLFKHKFSIYTRMGIPYLNQNRFEASKQIYFTLKDLNAKDIEPLLKNIISQIRKLTEIEAISLRLHENGDYPYYVYEGFHKDFILHENSLCVKNDLGDFLYEEDGSQYLLACMCGNIIRKRFDPSLDFFTERGSFFSNHTTQLLATTTDEDRQAHTRNYCNSCGFESVALIPISAYGVNIGLLQLNDKRQNMFTTDLIEFLEIVVEMIGEKLIKLPEFGSLSPINFQDLVISSCVYCRKVRNEQDEWVLLETYLYNKKNITEITFSHGICPKCLQIHYPDMIN